MPRPILFPRFATDDLNNGTGGAPNVVEPSSGKKDTGWNEGERPPRETFNWLHRITHDWLVYLDGVAANTGAASHFAQDVSATSGLNFAVGPGKATVNGDESEVASNTVVVLNAAETRFIWFDGVAVQSEDEAVVPPELDGGNDVLPLFRVTTSGGAITDIEDLRTWATMPSPTSSDLAVHEVRTANQTQEPVTFSPTDDTPNPDLADTNVFILRPNATPTNITIQTPANAEALSPTNTQEIHFIIKLNNSSQNVFWTGAYEFVDDPDFNGDMRGSDGLTYYASGVYDPVENVFKMTSAGGAKTWPSSSEEVAFKGADTSRSSTVTLANDPDLAVTLPPGRYRCTAFLNWTQSGAGGGNGIQMRLNVGSGTVDGTSSAGSLQYLDFSPGPAAVQGVPLDWDGSTRSITDTLTDFHRGHYEGFLDVTATANLAVQWAQNTSNADSVTLKEGSYLKFERIGESGVAPPPPSTVLDAGNGGTVQRVDGVSPFDTTVGIRFLDTGQVQIGTAINGGAISWTSHGQWIDPLVDASADFSVRYTGRAFPSGSPADFTTEASAEDVFVDMSVTRVYLMNKSDVGETEFDCDFQIQDDVGSLPTATRSYKFKIINTL